LIRQYSQKKSALASPVDSKFLKNIDSKRRINVVKWAQHKTLIKMKRSKNSLS